MISVRGWVATVLLSTLAAAAQAPKATPHAWRSVQIVGGGFVDGIVFHPTAKDVRYARTDMGGAYKWDPGTHRWQPLLDWMPYKDLNLMGVESIALDPADANRLYLACGTYTSANTPNGAILRSNDRGKTFQRTDMPFKFGGNEDGRGNGERMVVDPADGRVLFLGTRHNGLWRSSDRGVTWAQVTGFPESEEPPPAPLTPIPGETPQQRYRRTPVRGDGVVFVQFAPKGETSGSTQTIYAGVSLMKRANLFVSKDGGTSWHEVPGEPTRYRPERAALASDGFLYVAYGSAPGPTRMIDGGVWRLNTRDDTWKDITPDPPHAGDKQFGYAGISVDAQHPETVIVSSFGRPWSAGSEDIFRSTDGGAHWKTIFGKEWGGDGGGEFDYRLAPYVHKTPIHWLFDVEIDPTNPDHATFTTGYGGWETFDLTAVDRGKPTHWSIVASGIEEVVVLQLDSPTAGVELISAIGDYGGFTHASLDRPAPEGASSPPRLNNTTGVASATLKPEIVVRVGSNADHKPDANIGYSRDGGRSWQAPASTPAAGSQDGRIAVSADGATWTWTPDRSVPYVTHDLGTTWAAVQGLPSGTRIASDPIDRRLFYALSLREGKLYRSTDAAATFTSADLTLPDGPIVLGRGGRGDDRGGQDQIYLTPGRTGDLWLAAFNGLYHLSNVTRFARMPGVEEIHALGFGKAAPGATMPAIYLVGTVLGQPGIFLSTDGAATWTRINDDQHQWGLVLQIAGDPKRYGRVYVGTHGRGIFYGDQK